MATASENAPAEVVEATKASDIDAKKEKEEAKYSMLQAFAFNTMMMFGTGPLITIPYCLSAVEPAGPHAIVGYAFAAIACSLDSMVWAEIGSMWPETGGTYIYLRELYGRETWGRLASFMFMWQFLISGPAEIASGFIAIAEYMVYFSPDVLDYWPRVAISLGALFLSSIVLFRGVTDIGRLTILLWVITLASMAYTLIAGFSSWDPKNLEAPPDATKDGWEFVKGLGFATQFGVYDMTGYYDVCFLGGEVRNPKRTIPISCMATCCVVAVIYLLIYISVLGSYPWSSFIDLYDEDNDDSPPGIMSIFTEYRTESKGFAYVVTIFVAVTIFGSVFSMLAGLGYLPHAAAKDGLFFSIFSHESKWFPGVPDFSLALVVIGAAFFCFFDIALAIDAMSTMLVFVQFIGQSVGLIYYRYTTPKDKQPAGWRMPLFPLPCIIQILFFLIIWVMSPSYILWGDDEPILELAIGFLLLGCVMFLVRQKYHNGWPFGSGTPPAELETESASGASAPEASAPQPSAPSVEDNETAII